MPLNTPNPPLIFLFASDGAPNGPAGLLAGATMVLGHKFMRSDGTAGAIMPDNGDDLTPQLGQVMAGGVVSTEYVLGYLNVGI